MALGPQQFSYCLELPGGQHSTDFYVEGLAFPDADFNGLMPLTIALLDKSNPVGLALGLGWGGEAGITPCLPVTMTTLLTSPHQELPEALVFQDSVTVRVAPWIMTPNTQPPQEVYVCR